MTHRTLPLALAILVTLAAPGFTLAQEGAQPAQEQPKKKPHKVWTNDDFASGNRPAEEKREAPTEPQRSAEVLFAELDQARTDLAFSETNLRLSREQYETQLQLWRDADNDYDRDVYRESLDVAEQHIADTEKAVEDLKVRIAELERLTAGLKRPASMTSAAPKPPPRTIEDTPELVNPASGPVPQKEPPPPPEP